MVNINTENWLNEKISDYEDNPTEALEDILSYTHDVMIQYQNDPTSKAAKAVFDSCIDHNKIFLIEAGIINP